MSFHNSIINMPAAPALPHPLQTPPPLLPTNLPSLPPSTVSPNHLPPTSPPPKDPPTEALPPTLQRTLRVRTHHTRQREARVATHQEQISHVLVLRSMCLRCFTCYRSHWLRCSVANATNEAGVCPPRFWSQVQRKSVGWTAIRHVSSSEVPPGPHRTRRDRRGVRREGIVAVRRHP